MEVLPKLRRSESISIWFHFSITDLSKMRFDLKICLAVAFLFAMVLCSCRAVPLKLQGRAENALQRIIDQLMTRYELPQNINREEGYERDIRDIDVLGKSILTSRLR